MRKKIFGLQRGSKPEKKKEKNLSEREGKCHNGRTDTETL